MTDPETSVVDTNSDNIPIADKYIEPAILEISLTGEIIIFKSLCLYLRGDFHNKVCKNEI